MRNAFSLSEEMVARWALYWLQFAWALNQSKDALGDMKHEFSNLFQSFGQPKQRNKCGHLSTWNKLLSWFTNSVRMWGLPLIPLHIKLSFIAINLPYFALFYTTNTCGAKVSWKVASCANVSWLGDQTLENLRLLAFEFWARSKLSRTHASNGQMESQVSASWKS